MEESQNPSLKITVEKGPRKGETLEARPGSSSIRIGRVVRGNNLTIKDPGISQKHLNIIFADGKWTVTDLDTSNGTLLNDVHLEALSPSALADGDVIKIGESTSITVKIGGTSDHGPEQLEIKPGRNRGQRGRANKGRSESEDELARMESVPVDPVNGKGGERSDFGIGLGRNTRRQAARSKARGAVKDDPVKEDTASESLDGGLDAAVAAKVEKKVPVANGLRRNPRRRNAPTEANVASKDDAAPSGSVLVEEVPKSSNLGLDAMKTSEATSIPVQIEGRNDLENAQAENMPDRNPRRQGGRNKAKVSLKEEQVPSERLSAQEVAETSGFGAENAASVEGASALPKELEKITLGEWFDHMERYLPKQINDAAEEMIQSLRQRHKQFVDFMEQRSVAKGKLPVVT